jgi:hypothetical protein
MQLQEMLEERRRDEEKRNELRLARRRATVVRYLVEGVMLFALLEWLFHGLTPGRLLLLAVPGVALGWICARLRVGQSGYAIAGAIAYVAVYGPLGVLTFWHFVCFVVLAGAAGFMHQLQRADGSEA